MEENGILKAAGMLIGMNMYNHFALAALLLLIFDAASDYEWA